MEQILMNLVAGALGGNAAGKASPSFDLGTLGNTLAGLAGGGILGQLITLLMPAITAAALRWRSEYRQYPHAPRCGWRRWCGAYGPDRIDQEQGRVICRRAVR